MYEGLPCSVSRSPSFSLCSLLLPRWLDLDYNRDIRPILAESCFNCHVPDANSRKAKLWLDTAEGATAERQDGMVPIVPGQPESSALVTRIGTTDDYCYDITEDWVHVHDLNATILHLLGIDLERLTHKFQGRQFRLTDVCGQLIRAALA